MCVQAVQWEATFSSSWVRGGRRALQPDCATEKLKCYLKPHTRPLQPNMARCWEAYPLLAYRYIQSSAEAPAQPHVQDPRRLLPVQRHLLLCRPGAAASQRCMQSPNTIITNCSHRRRP